MMHRIDLFAFFVVLSASFSIQQIGSLEPNNIRRKQPGTHARLTTPAPTKTTRKEESHLERGITNDESTARSHFLSALNRLLADLHRSRNKDIRGDEEARKTRISANQTNEVKSQKSLEQSQEEGEEAPQDRGLTLLDGFLDSCGGDSSDDFFTDLGPLNLTALCNHPIGQSLPICALPEPPTFSPTISSNTKTKKKSKKSKSTKAKEPKTEKGKTKKKAKTTGIASSTTAAPVSVAPTTNPTGAPSPPLTSRPTRQPITTPPTPMSGRGQPPDEVVPDPPPFDHPPPPQDDPPQLPPQGDPPQLPP